MSLIRGRQSGFTLIEVLIALLVLAIGLLGMASLTMTSLQSNQSAYQRGQASQLASDLVERMRGNIDQATLGQSPYAVTLDTDSTPNNPDCRTKTVGCSPSEQAAQDMFDWWANLQGAIPGATAAITRSNGNEYQIVITWTESDSQQRSSSTQTNSFTLRVNL